MEKLQNLLIDIQEYSELRERFFEFIKEENIDVLKINNTLLGRSYITIYNKEKKRIHKKMKNRFLHVILHLQNQGYKNIDIEKLLGLSYNFISNYIKHMSISEDKLTDIYNNMTDDLKHIFNNSGIPLK